MSPVDGSPKTRPELTIAATFLEVRRLSSWLADLEARWSAESGFAGRAELALAELCNNIIEHGYAHADGNELTLRASRQPSAVCVEVVDDAAEFALGDADLGGPSEPTVHGYGLMIVEQLTDEFTVARVADTNVWSLTFPVERSNPAN